MTEAGYGSMITNQHEVPSDSDPSTVLPTRAPRSHQKSRRTGSRWTFRHRPPIDSCKKSVEFARAFWHRNPSREAGILRIGFTAGVEYVFFRMYRGNRAGMWYMILRREKLRVELTGDLVFIDSCRLLVLFGSSEWVFIFHVILWSTLQSFILYFA